MMYVLDTDTLSLLLAGHPKVNARRDAIPAHEIATTIITWIETLQGRFDFLLKAADRQELLRAQRWLVLTKAALEDLGGILPVDAPAADEFDRLRQMPKVRRIGRKDLLIASITLALDATVVTRNLKHFRQVPRLKVENWAD